MSPAIKLKSLSTYTQKRRTVNTAGKFLHFCTVDKIFKGRGSSNFPLKIQDINNLNLF